MKSKETKRKEALKRAEVAQKESYGDVCQDCKYHKNNPSRCQVEGFVGRKAPACADFKMA